MNIFNIKTRLCPNVYLNRSHGQTLAAKELTDFVLIVYQNNRRLFKKILQSQSCEKDNKKHGRNIPLHSLSLTNFFWVIQPTVLAGPKCLTSK